MRDVNQYETRRSLRQHCPTGILGKTEHSQGLASRSFVIRDLSKGGSQCILQARCVMPFWLGQVQLVKVSLSSMLKAYARRSHIPHQLLNPCREV